MTVTQVWKILPIVHMVKVDCACKDCTIALLDSLLSSLQALTSEVARLRQQQLQLYKENSVSYGGGAWPNDNRLFIETVESSKEMENKVQACKTTAK